MFVLNRSHFTWLCCNVVIHPTTICLPPLGGAAPSDRSASGLLEWESINDAMEALAMMNHYQMKNASMCFKPASPRPGHIAGKWWLLFMPLIAVLFFQLDLTHTPSNCVSPLFNTPTNYAYASRRGNMIPSVPCSLSLIRLFVTDLGDIGFFFPTKS